MPVVDSFPEQRTSKSAGNGVNTVVVGGQSHVGGGRSLVACEDKPGKPDLAKMPCGETLLHVIEFIQLKYLSVLDTELTSSQLQSSNKPISAGGPPASPSMKQVEATRSLIPITTQMPSSMQISSPSADTPIGGLYIQRLEAARGWCCTRIVGFGCPGRRGRMRRLWRCRRCIRPAEEPEVKR